MDSSTVVSPVTRKQFHNGGGLRIQYKALGGVVWSVLRAFLNPSECQPRSPCRGAPREVRPQRDPVTAPGSEGGWLPLLGRVPEDCRSDEAGNWQERGVLGLCPPQDQPCQPAQESRAAAIATGPSQPPAMGGLLLGLSPVVFLHT